MSPVQACRSIGATLRRALPALVVSMLAAAPALAQGDIDLGSGEALTLWQFVVLSGLVGWLICILSVVTLAVVIENFVMTSRDKLAPPELVDELQSLFDEGQFQEAMELCESERNFFTRVCAAGIAKIGHDFGTIEQAITEMGDQESVKLHQKIGWVAVIAGVSTMLGLFGTVQGMIASFHVIASQANPTPADLATGIYVALLTTFEG